MEFSKFFLLDDPDLGWDRCWFGSPADEAFGVDAIVSTHTPASPQLSRGGLGRNGSPLKGLAIDGILLTGNELIAN
jgi:hypothetical protein